jgi:nicotinamidase-related amidase
LFSHVTNPVLAFAQDARPSERPAHLESALVVVDAQVGVLSSIWESGRVVGNIETLVTRARRAGVPVVWVQHSDEELKHGSEAWKLAPNFVPAGAETVIHKKFNSSFADTGLDRTLKAFGVSRIVLAGAATNWCIRSTAYAAIDRGYGLLLVSDAHSTEDMRFSDGTMVSAQSIVLDLNTVFQWVSAPGVRTEVRKTAEVAF